MYNQCAVPEKKKCTPFTEGIGISWEWEGDFVRPKNLKKCMKFTLITVMCDDVR